MWQCILQLIQLMHHFFIEQKHFFLMLPVEWYATHATVPQSDHPVPLEDYPMFFILSLKTAHKFPIGLISGDLAGQYITSILQTRVVCGLALFCWRISMSWYYFHEEQHMLGPECHLWTILLWGFHLIVSRNGTLYHDRDPNNWTDQFHLHKHQSINLVIATHSPFHQLSAIRTILVSTLRLQQSCIRQNVVIISHHILVSQILPP